MHQLAHTRPIERTAVSCDRGHADLLGEHGDARGEQHVDLVGLDPPDERVGRFARVLVDDQQRLSRAHFARGSPERLEKVPQRPDQACRPDDRGAATPLASRSVGERPHRGVVPGDGNEVGTGETEAPESAFGLVAPHLRAQPPWLQTDCLDA